MPQPLMDRMEIIRLAGYTEDEKVAIARKHLIIKQIEANGLREGELDLHDDAVRDLVRYYTREAGVRNLEREIANLARKATKEILMKGSSKVKIRAKNLDKYAGVRRFRYGEAELEDLVGITTGLAWTEVGGELLQIEAVLVPGRGRMTVTGKLGDVMQESVQAANAYVRSRANSFGIKPLVFEKRDIHIHVPEGATPKDGPSAGVGMITSIVSALTGVAVRKEVAMTGEISLRGRVLPIGGLKEKLLAALRGGLKTVLIPKENERDLPEIPDNVKKGLEIVPVATVDEVLARALVKPLVAIEWPNDLEPAVPAKPAEGAEAIRAH
jgi:ATP-dependent Lon protease